MVAEVIVDISSSEIDRIFDYEIGSLEIGAGSPKPKATSSR